MTVTVFGTGEELDRLDAAGYELGATIEGPRPGVTGSATARAACESREARRRGRARRAVGTASHEDEIVDPARRLLRELRGPLPVGRGEGRARAARHRTDVVHRPDALALVGHRRGNADRLDPAHDERQHRPGHDARHLHRASRARAHRRRRARRSGAGPTGSAIGSSTGASMEAAVDTWLGGGPAADEHEASMRDFTTHYMDPTEVYGRFERARGGVPEHRPADHRCRTRRTATSAGRRRTMAGD